MSMNDPKREILIEEIPYVDEVVKKLAQNADALRKTESDLAYLEEAYERCRMFAAEHEKILMVSVFGQLPKEQRQATWAIYAWGRRIDDLVDSTNEDTIRSDYVDQWEERTKDILNGKPHDILDAALIDTISKFHIDHKLFEDGIEGLRMDITKKRYANFEELFEYCYRVSGILGLMQVQVAGLPQNQRAELGRIYLPQDELARFGLCDEDILSGNVCDGWKEFMKMQIQRARFYYNLGKQGVSQYNKATRAKHLSVLMVYRQILDEIEEKDYDNLTNKIGSQF